MPRLLTTAALVLALSAGAALAANRATDIRHAYEAAGYSHVEVTKSKDAYTVSADISGSHHKFLVDANGQSTEVTDTSEASSASDSASGTDSSNSDATDAGSSTDQGGSASSEDSGASSNDTGSTSSQDKSSASSHDAASSHSKDAGSKDAKETQKSDHSGKN